MRLRLKTFFNAKRVTLLKENNFGGQCEKWKYFWYVRLSNG